MVKDLTPLLNENEAAALLGLAVATLRRWRSDGRGPRFTKLGDSVRYERESLSAFVEAGRRETADTEGRAA